MIDKDSNTHKFLFFRSFCFFIFLFSAASVSTNAQETMRIAALVNNEIITVRDIENRLRIVLFSSNIRPTKSVIKRLGKQVLQTLIDEKLKFAIAKKNRIEVTKGEFLAAVAELEKNNKIGPGRFREFLISRGIDWHAMSNQIRAQILWSKLARRILMPRVIASDSEISARLDQLSESRNKREYNISEILLSVTDEERRSVIKEYAQRLSGDIKGGANFAILAEQFSDSTSSSAGGSIGWHRIENLPAFIRPQILKMKAGDVSDPIGSLEGFYIIRVDKIRELGAKDEEIQEVNLRRIFLPADSKNTREDGNKSARRIEQIREKITSCDEFDQAAKDIGFNSDTYLGKIKLNDLSQEIAKEVRTLPIGQPSLPVQVGNQIAIFVVCQRWSTSPYPHREKIRQQILKEKLDIVARKFLRDMRVNAIIDIRI